MSAMSSSRKMFSGKFFTFPFVGCVTNNLKYFVIFFALMDFYGAGHLISPEDIHNSGHDGDKWPLTPTVALDPSNHIHDADDNFYALGSNKTFFRTQNNSIIVSQVGSVAMLPCRAHINGDETVSWIRRNDYHLLTVGVTTYNSDERRFSVIHSNETEDWQLQIKFVQLKDAGSYECAVSSHPSISLFVQLHVTESKAKIVGPPERYLKPGSTLRLTCKILDNIENPQFIFWYHNTRMVNYDSHLGINVTVQLDNKFSELLIVQTNVANSGNYSCLASNAAASSVIVHILYGENPFGLAMYGGASMNFNSNQSICVTLTFLMILFATYQLDLVTIDTHDVADGRQRHQLLRDSGQISIF